jgi:hypothetical protein
MLAKVREDVYFDLVIGSLAALVSQPIKRIVTKQLPVRALE